MLARFRGSNSRNVARVLRLRSSALQPESRPALGRVVGAVRERSSSCVRSGVDLVHCPPAAAAAAARVRLFRPAMFSRSVATSSRDKGQRHPRKPSKAKQSHSAKDKRAHRQPRQNGGSKTARPNMRPTTTNGNNAKTNRPHDRSTTGTTAHTFSRKKLGSLAAVEDQLRNLGNPGYLPATSLSVAQCIHACVFHGDIPAAVHILSQLTHIPLAGGSTQAESEQAPLKFPNLTSQRERQRQRDQKEQGLGHVADAPAGDNLPEISASATGAGPEFGEGVHAPAPDAGVYARFIFACAQVNDREAYEHAVSLLRWVHKRVFAGAFDAEGKMVDAWVAVAQASGRHAKAPAVLRLLADFPSCPVAQQDGEVDLSMAAARVFGEAIHRSGHKRAERAEQILTLYESKGYGVGGCSDDSLSIRAGGPQGSSVTRVYDEMALIYTATKNWEAVDLIFQSLRDAGLPCTGACLAVFTSIDRSLPPEAALRMRNMSASQVEAMTATDSPAGIIRRLTGYVDEELAHGSPLGHTLVPVAEVYNKAISALSKLGDCDGSLRALQLGLKASSRSASSKDDGVPSSEAARSLISVCCAFRRFDEATGLLNMMGSQWGLRPTPQQYKSVLSALAQQPPHDKSQPAKRARVLIATLLAELGRNPGVFENMPGQDGFVKFQGKKNAKAAKGRSAAAEGTVLYDCFYSAVQAQIKAGLWQEALAIAVELPAEQRNAAHGQSLATLYPPGSSAAAAASGTRTLSLDTVACGAEECDVKLTTIVVKAAMQAEDWDAVLAVHDQLVAPPSDVAAAAVAAAPEANVQRRMEEAFRAFDVQYFRAVAAAMFKRRRWADALKLRSLWVQRHPSRGCLQIARTLLYAAERTNAVEEGLEVLEDLQLRKRRIKAELPVAAAIRLLERRGGQSDRACEMLDRWLNDVSYGQLSPPGYDTFQSVARACLAEGKDQLSREVIAKRKKFHNRVKEDTPTAPELSNLF